MSTPPSMLQDGTTLSESYALINDNFRKVVSDIADLGGKTSSTFASNTGSLGVGAQYTNAIGITDTANQYANGVSNIVVKIDIFVDTDNDFNFIWNNGASLTAGQRKLAPMVILGLTPPTGTKGVVYINFVNNDTGGAHTYYYHLAVDFVPKAITGEFR